MPNFCKPLIVAVGLLLSSPARADMMELFAKGSASKIHLNTSDYIVSVSASTGVALTIIPRLRIEARYTNSTSLQNRLALSVPGDGGDPGFEGTLNDFLTQTAIYSVGVDVDLLGPQSSFQPFLYAGAGYVHSERSYYALPDGVDSSVYIRETPQTKISVNAGAGFRLRVAQALALEVEVFAYGMDVHLPNPVINIMGSAGIRLFL